MTLLSCSKSSRLFFLRTVVRPWAVKPSGSEMAIPIVFEPTSKPRTRGFSGLSGSMLGLYGANNYEDGKQEGSKRGGSGRSSSWAVGRAPTFRGWNLGAHRDGD